MGKRKKARRTKTSHPGVKLKKVVHRSGATSWVARYVDPDSNRERQQSLTQFKLTSQVARVRWAREKSDELARRKLDLARGATRHSGETLTEAIDSYFSTKGLRLAGSTQSSYRLAADLFLRWAGASGVKLTDDLRPRHLAEYVEWMSVQPAKAAVRGGSRRDREPTSRRISAGAVNVRLRSLKAILNHLRRLERLAHITSDDIKDKLKPLRTQKPRPGFLRRRAIKDLLKAALRHDAALYRQTREEKASRAVARTPRHEAIAPFVAYMILTGSRLGEALGVTWAAIDFDAVDEGGVASGEIVLRAESVKTRHERVIDMLVSPALRAMLQAMKLKAGDSTFVFGGESPWTRSQVERARRRLIADYGAPRFTWSQTHGSTPALRSTCATYLTNAPGIFVSASAYRSAKQLGHSVAIAERHYLGLLRGLSPMLGTLDAVMGIGQELGLVRARILGVHEDSVTLTGKTARS